MLKKSVVKSFLILVSLLLFYYQNTLAQPDTLWTKTFGGSGADEGWSVQQTVDGGFIVAGFTESFGAGNADVWLIKLDIDGNEEWNQTFGGENEDEGFSVAQTMDGGYIVAGDTWSFGAGGSDVWLIKTDASGNEVWNRTFGGSGNDGAWEVQQTADSGYVIVGGSFLYKTDADGNEQWTQLIFNSMSSVHQTSDGGYIVGGQKFNQQGKRDVRLLKTDGNGNELWSRTFGGANENDDARSVRETTDGGYIIAGSTRSFGAGATDFWLIKTDENGNEVWNRTFGGQSFDDGHSVQQTQDGGYIIAGNTLSFGAGDLDVWLVKVDAAGDEEWNRAVGESGQEQGYYVSQTADGGYIVTGRRGGFGENRDVFLVRISADSSLTSVEAKQNEIPSEFSLGQNFPNPFNPSTAIDYMVKKGAHVKIDVFSVTGQHIKTLVDGRKSAGTHQLRFRGGNLAGGIYFYRMFINGRLQETKKMLLLK